MNNEVHGACMWMAFRAMCVHVLHTRTRIGCISSTSRMQHAGPTHRVGSSVTNFTIFNCWIGAKRVDDSDVSGWTRGVIEMVNFCKAKATHGSDQMSIAS